VLVSLGAAMIAGFVLLRFLNDYGDPQRWNPQATTLQTAMAFLNVQKYPPSLLYVCATLGPMLLLIPLFDRARGRVVDILRTYGAVPLMAYVAHLYLMHALALAAHAAAGQSTTAMFNTVFYFMLHPEVFGTTGFSLLVVYAAWLTVLILLYPLCRWWAGVKRRRRDWWLSYL
jgi:hypothetical protein